MASSSPAPVTLPGLNNGHLMNDLSLTQSQLNEIFMFIRNLFAQRNVSVVTPLRGRHGHQLFFHNFRVQS